MNNDNKKARSTFSGKMGYVLSVAGSAVGLGNIWRFPYLAAKYGGGIFLLVYLLLVLTFGFALIVSETALGRMTHKSPIGAFRAFGNKLPFKIGGWVNAVIPMLILPYYCVIGGWVIKYFAEYVMGNVYYLAQDNYFNEFMSNGGAVEFWLIIFTLLVIGVILMGVKNGVEKVSVVMMPLLILLAIVLAIYSVTRPGAMEGVKYFLIPDFNRFSAMTVVSAMGQMFYSLSIAMGILYTYGSYLKEDVDIEKSTKQIEVFDTLVAVLAGLMIIPAVFAFSGGNAETLQAGPSLMFITIPKVFASMGFGTVAGVVFFLLVFFAALTSAISLAETCVSTFEDEFEWGRGKAVLVVTAITLVLGTLSALGFNELDFIKILGMTILDFFDFITNSVMMPFAALATCILVVKAVGLDRISAEVTQSSPFKRKKMYKIFMKYFSVACILIILFSSIANVFGWISM